MCSPPFSSPFGLVAFDDVVLRAWARYGLAAAGLRVLDVRDRAALFDALADQPRLLVIGPTFDRAPVAPLLAAVRTTGCDLVTVVVGAGRAAPRLWWRFDPVATLDGALDSRALRDTVLDLLDRPHAPAPPRLHPSHATQ